MNINAFMDGVGMAVGSTLAKNVRYFSDGVASRPLVELPALVDVEVPDITSEGLIEVAGAVDGADINPAILVQRWIGPQAPLVIYHHGAAEGGFTFSFNRTLRHRSVQGANVVAVRAPSSGTNREFYERIRTLRGYTSLIAGSVALVERVIGRFRTVSDCPVLVTGISLGGVVSCLHSRVFGTADMWMPLYAGPDLGEVFVSSAYSRMTDETAKREHADAIRSTLSFGTEFMAGPTDRVFPVLGRHDRYFEFQKQAGYYRPENRTVTELSHSTGSTKFAFLRSRIMERIGAEQHHVSTGRA